MISFIKRFYGQLISLQPSHGPAFNDIIVDDH